MAILLTGDLHGSRGIDRLAPEAFPEGEMLDRDDFLIIAGDFEVIYEHTGLTRHERQLLSWLSDRPWTTLFIDGNHEHMPRLRSLTLEERFGGMVGRAAEHVYYLQRGARYTIDERTFLCLGGAYSIDRDKRIPGESWFHEEVPTEADLAAARESASQGRVDVLLSHTCPSDIRFQLPIPSRNDISDPTEHMLAELRPLARPRFWVFGHFHVNSKLREQGIEYTCLFDEIALLDPKLGTIPLGKKPMTMLQSRSAGQAMQPDGFGAWGGE